MADGAPEGETELRPCAYCGAAIDPRCHRCSECGGHVGLAWKTVDGELFGMIFASVLIGIGCLVSWEQRRPGAFTGTDTVRGSLMLAFAVYGVISGVMNVLYRRHVIWPVFLNSILAIWTGLEGILGSMDSAAWKAAGAETTEQVSYFEKYFGGYVRAIPPGFLLLTFGGALVLMVVIKGLVAGAGSASAKAKAAEAAREADAEARRARRLSASNPDAPPEIPGGDVPPPAPPV
jgi:hypothetical protein